MTQQQLIRILQELSVASKSVSTESDVQEIMTKYDMMFLGEKFNHIYSLELRHSLSKCFGFKISNNELNNLIPSTCESMGLSYSPMLALNDLPNPDRQIYCYQIKLW